MEFYSISSRYFQVINKYLLVTVFSHFYKRLFMTKIILMDLADASADQEFNFDSLPETKKDLQNVLKEKGYEGSFKKRSMTIIENMSTLELPNAKIPTNYPVLTIILNPIKKMKAGAVDFSECEGILPDAEDNYHDAMKALRTLRTWSEENEVAALQDILSRLRTNTKKDELFENIIPAVREFTAMQLEPEVTADVSGITDRIDSIETRLTTLEMLNGIVNDVSAYIQTMADKIQQVKDYYHKK